MKSSLACLAFAALLIGDPSTTRAGLILDTMPTNTAAYSEIRAPGNSDGGITTQITVGSSNVVIGSFGTYGQLLNSGDLKWVIFSSTSQSSPIFSTASTPTAAGTGPQWYVSSEIDFTLSANQTYYLGVISDANFTYDFDYPGTSVTSGGLTANAGDNGNTGSSYANPVNDGDGGVLNSFEAFSPAVVPEPSSVLLLGIASSMVAGFCRIRRRSAIAA